MGDPLDATDGAEPHPEVQIEGQRHYPLFVEKLVTFSVFIASLLMIPPALAADLPLGFLQAPLIICGFPIIGLLVARLLTLPIQVVSNN